MIGQRVVDHINLCIGQQLFITAVGFGNVELRSGGLCFSQSREAMAATSRYWQCCIAGMTLSARTSTCSIFPSVICS